MDSYRTRPAVPASLARRYKPLLHYQRDLKPVVLAAMGPSHRIGEALATYGTTSLVAARPRRLATDDVVVPAPGARERAPRRTSVGLTGGPIAALRDF